MEPHEEKLLKGGEDAAVISERLVAVCDGVGGWSTQGIDPAEFS